MKYKSTDRQLFVNKVNVILSWRASEMARNNRVFVWIGDFPPLNIYTRASGSSTEIDNTRLDYVLKYVL